MTLESVERLVGESKLRRVGIVVGARAGSDTGFW